MKNNGSFKNAGSSRAKMWRNILLILGAVALIASYFADIRDPHPGTETQDNRPYVEQAHKDGFQTLHARVTRVADGDTVYINVNFQRFPTLDAKKLVNAPKMSAHHRGICHF